MGQYITKRAADVKNYDTLDNGLVVLDTRELADGRIALQGARYGEWGTVPPLNPDAPVRIWESFSTEAEALWLDELERRAGTQ